VIHFKRIEYFVSGTTTCIHRNQIMNFGTLLSGVFILNQKYRPFTQQKIMRVISSPFYRIEFCTLFSRLNSSLLIFFTNRASLHMCSTIMVSASLLTFLQIEHPYTCASLWWSHTIVIQLSRQSSHIGNVVFFNPLILFWF